MQFLNVVLFVASTVSASVIAAQATQCAVCPARIGPVTDGSFLPLSGASAQLGAPTFCM